MPSYGTEDLIRKRLLQPAPLTDMCSQMFVESDEEQDLELKVQFWSLILELMTLYAQLELLTEDVRLLRLHSSQHYRFALHQKYLLIYKYCRLEKRPS